MRMTKLVGRRIKEDPKDAKTISHKYLIRGGYIRPVSAGIYSLLPVGKRIVEKIENIIREEMDKIDEEIKKIVAAIEEFRTEALALELAKEKVVPELKVIPEEIHSL